MEPTPAADAHVVEILACLRAASSIRPSAWSAANRILSSESSSRTGRLTLFPYQSEPMDESVSTDVVETLLMWAAQLGKSELFNCLTGYFMEAEPSPQLFVQPTVDLAEAYSADRIAPMIRESPALKALVKSPRSRDSGNKILSKRYPGGSLVLLGANAPAGLAGRPRRVILQDEVDRYPASAGKEGDPCALADKRAESFPDAVKAKSSTPTVKGTSRIERMMEGSDFRKWHCPCPRCSHVQVWSWRQVRWEPEKTEEAWLECEGCHAHLTDEERVASVRAGSWIATKPFKGVRGYWLNGINTLFACHSGFRNRLHEMADEFLKAKRGGPDTLRVWTNTFLAETFEEQSITVDPTAVAGRDEEYILEPIPEEVLLVTAGGDIQGDRIEIEFVGWGRDEERFGLGKHVLSGDPKAEDDLWTRLDALILQEFTTAGGAKLRAERVLIDMQFANQRVLAFCAPRVGRGVYPCRGVNRVGPVVPPLLPAKPSRNNRARIPHWNIGVTVAKQTMYDRVLIAPPGPRTMHWPKGCGYDEDHFRQLVAEKKKLRYQSGQPYTIFEKDHDSVRNEAMDLWVYSYAALQTLYPLSWDAYEATLKRKEQQSAATIANAGGVVPPMPRRGGWATRW